MQNIYAFGIPVQWSISWGVASKADGRLSTISGRSTNAPIAAAKRRRHPPPDSAKLARSVAVDTQILRRRYPLLRTFT
jgi:hypothetical protein